MGPPQSVVRPPGERFAIGQRAVAQLPSATSCHNQFESWSNGRAAKPKPQKYTADSVVIVADAVSGERLIAVVVEPQGRASDDKNQSWPVYATTARKVNKCQRAVLIVACWDPSEADGCRRIIATGHPGLVFVPIVIDRNNAPPLAGASPYLVLFNAVIGAVDLDTKEGRALAVGAITASPAA